MNKNAIKKFAVWAREELIKRCSTKAEEYGISKDEIVDANAEALNDRPLTEVEIRQRKALISKIKKDGYEQAIEEVAYTWFNRFVALRFMEVNNYLSTHVRVFTDVDESFNPQIMKEALHLELSGLDRQKVIALKEADKNDELYKYLLITQCNALSPILPKMFQRIDDYTELLFPDNILREGSVIDRMVRQGQPDSIPKEDWTEQVQIIGWLYQYYISEKHEEVVDPLHGKVVKKEEVPAATQLFTTDWVVRYLIDNSVGRYWIERNPNSTLADKLTYFVKPKDGVIKTIDEKITPQDVTTFDPCVGSGHFLIYAFDVLMKIYVEYGYSERDAAAEIVKNNLFGLDIDGRASQLAYFSVMMKARQYDRRFFTRGIQPNIYEIRESNTADKASIEHFCGSDATLKKDIEALLDTLKDAKEYGSILQMPAVDFGKINERFEQLSGEISMYNTYLLGDFQELIRPAEIMGGKYAVVATNPPYLNKYDGKLKEFINSRYKDYSGDLFSVFMYRNFGFCKHNGYTGFMTPFVWMFIKTYEELRRLIINEKSLVSLIQMEYSAYEEATVPICTFLIGNAKNEGEATLCIKLSEFRGGMAVQNQKVLEAIDADKCEYFYEAHQSNFRKITGEPIAYWISDNAFRICDEEKVFEDFATTRAGMITGNNSMFMRLWHEVDFEKFGILLHSREDAIASKKKWFPYNKGGDYRKWYGNNEYVVNWENDGFFMRNFKDEKGKIPAHAFNLDYIFKENVTWSSLSSYKFAARYTDYGFLYDASGSFADVKTENLYYTLAFLCSSVTMYFLSALNPTLNFQKGNISSLPFILINDRIDEVTKWCKDSVSISRTDWDSFETSWDFQSHPLAPLASERQAQLSAGMNSEERKKAVTLLSERYRRWEQECEYRFSELKKNEEELNRIFIDIYGLQDELTPEVEDKDVTVRKADLQRDIRSLISYAVGCMFGRYSLDVPGLAYAGGEWDASKYCTFIPDKDNIIPICDDEYFEDDVVGRFVKFIEVVYGKETLEENLKFTADALGGKGTSREVIRNYFLNDFYADHLKIYQKRPIYWLFDSGKKNGFKALIYMHRYQPDTIARMRTDYVHEQQARYRTAMEDMEHRIAGAATSERVKLTKPLTRLKDQDAELRVYEEKIHHLADQMIRIDLDDGVKHNYENFKDVLAKIK